MSGNKTLIHLSTFSFLQRGFRRGTCPNNQPCGFSHFTWSSGMKLLHLQPLPITLNTCIFSFNTFRAIYIRLGAIRTIFFRSSRKFFKEIIRIFWGKIWKIIWKYSGSTILKNLKRIWELLKEIFTELF